MPIDFCWGLLTVTTEKGKATEISYSDTRSLVGFHILTTGNVFLCLTIWFKRERTSKRSAIWLILRGYAPSYKSDNHVFRCSFYYLNFCGLSIKLLVIYIKFYGFFCDEAARDFFFSDWIRKLGKLLGHSLLQKI
jgi:hypothetical protein